MSSSGGDDAMTAAKAMERKARLAHMMQGAGVEDVIALGTNNNNKNEATMTADSIMDQKPAARQKNEKNPKAANVSHSASLPTSASSALMELERRIAGDDKKSLRGVTTTGPAMPGSVTQVHFLTTHANEVGRQLLSAQERDLVAKSSGTDAVTAAAAAEKVAAASTQNQLSTREQDLLAKASAGAGRATSGDGGVDAAAVAKASTMGNVLHRLMGGGGGTAPSNASVVPQRLHHLEVNALVKQQLPRETPSGGKSSATNAADGSSKEMEAQYDGTAAGEETTGHDLTSSSALTAEIVDEAEERDKIAKSIISTAVVATMVDEHAEKRQTRKLFGLVTCALLILTAIVLGGVCGTGNCSKGPSAAERAEALTKFIASITTTSTSSTPPLVYPYTGDLATSSPEQEALIHLIEDDPLKLSVVSNGDMAANWRLLQRYVLLIIWFTNGPFTEPVAPDGGGGRSAASAEWLVGSHECGWSGIDCDDGRVVQLSLIQRGLTGTVPWALGLLTDLVGLRLSDGLEGSLADVIATLAGVTTRLVTLELNSCLFEGTLPGERLPEFVSLKTLELSGNRLTGTIPESIGTMTKLESLDLSFNSGLTGTIQSSLAGLTSLTKLGLSNFDPSSSTAFDFLSEMKDLTYLHLGSITTTVGEGQLPSWVPLSEFSKLTHLALSKTQTLEGTIPADVVNWWPNMNHLFLIDCNLTGTIPAALAQWTRLETLDLTLNQLSGSLPLASYAAWSDTFTIFLVPFNQISGSLSSEIGLWSNLKILALNGNQFTGSLPTTIGLLTNADGVFFAQNRFSGTIPTEVTNFKYNAVVSYQDNNFIGTAPFCLDEIPGLVQDTVDCDEVVCTCCTGCQG